MALNLARIAIIKLENNEDLDLIVIKRVKKTSKSRISQIVPFTSDYLI